MIKRKKIGIILILIFVVSVIGLYQFSDMHLQKNPDTPIKNDSRTSQTRPGGDAPRTGPGLPPPDGLLHMVMPDEYPVIPEDWQSPESHVPTPDFVRLERSLAGPPVFPDLSPYSHSGYFTKPQQSEHIIVRGWYFADSENFTMMQEHLLDYLDTHGNTSIRRLNPGKKGSDWNSTCEAMTNITLKAQCYGATWKQFPVTAYSDTATAGYFFASERPFLPGHDDYFIVYYGIFNSTNPSGSLETLNRFMEMSNRGFVFEGQIHEIKGKNIQDA